MFAVENKLGENTLDLETQTQISHLLQEADGIKQETKMENTQQQEQPKKVVLWSRAKAAELDTETGEVHLVEGVDSKWLVQDLVREIQALQLKIQELEKKVVELTPKNEGDI